MCQQLGQGYQRLLLDLILSGAKREFESICPDPCTVYDRKECIDITLNRLREFGERLDPESTDQFIEDQIRQDREMADSNNQYSKKCNACIEVFSMERDRMIQSIKDLSAIRRSLKRNNQDIFISDLQDELVLSYIIEPLAKPVCFSMMKALSNGSMSHSELS